jgi:hypothetical protein
VTGGPVLLVVVVGVAVVDDVLGAAVEELVLVELVLGVEVLVVGTVDDDVDGDVVDVVGASEVVVVDVVLASVVDVEVVVGIAVELLVDVDEVVATVVVGSGGPVHVQSMQVAFEQPRPASHSSPASGSKTPSLQTDRVAVKSFLIFAFFARNVPDIARHVGSIFALKVAFPAMPAQPLNVTLMRVPAFVTLSFSRMAGQPLRIPMVSPMVTTSGEGGALESTSTRPPSTK